jgi:protein-L-isoaspartate(D-aspartate) O-methyltransferase
MEYAGRIDEIAPSYIFSLVQTLKSQGWLKSSDLINAFQKIPRHAFIECFYTIDTSRKEDKLAWKKHYVTSEEDIPLWLEQIYANDPLVTLVDEAGRPICSSTAPWLMAQMLEQLSLTENIKVLEIGTGTGYNAALLAAVVGNPSSIYSIDIISSLVEHADKAIKRVLGKPINVTVGNGLEGSASGAPYDRIIATGSSKNAPISWFNQLRNNGLLIFNLQWNINGNMLLVQKSNDGKSAKGIFLDGPSTAFIELRESIPNTSANISSLLQRYLILSPKPDNPLDSKEFRPALLHNDHFLFFLQLHFHHINRIFLKDVSTTTICLIDTPSQTIVSFREDTSTGHYSVYTYGQEKFWEEIKSVYREWTLLEEPRIVDFEFYMDETGSQYLRLPRKKSVWQCSLV